MNSKHLLQRCLKHSLYRPTRAIVRASIRTRDGHNFKRTLTPSIQRLSFECVRLHSTSLQCKDEIKEVYDKSLKFLDGSKTMTSSKECAALIDEWYICLSNNETESSKTFDPYRYLTGGLIESERNELSKYMHIIDNLSHKLLDFREKMGRNRVDDRTQYRILLHLVLTLWSHAPPSRNNGPKAQRILDRIIKISKSCKDKSLIPTEKEYGCVIHAWANTIDHDDTDGGTMALRLLDDLSNIKNVQSSRIAYNTTLHALASRGRIDDVEKILDRMENSTPQGSVPGPDVFTYSTVLNAYQKSNKSRKQSSIAKRAEALIHRMLRRYNETGDITIRPNQYTFGSVISLFATSKSPHAAKDADRILQWQISLYENENIETTVIEGTNEKEQLKYTLAPGVPHFVSVILAYSNSKQRGSAERIAELLMDMERLQEAGNPQLKPTYQCFVIYLNALSKSRDPDAALKAEKVLDTIENMCLNSSDDSFELNNYGYNLVIDAWAHSSMKGRAAKAEAVISRLKRLHKLTGIDSLAPDKFTYTSYIDAIINDGDPGFEDRCLQIVQEMNEAENVKVHADTVTYNLVTKAFMKAGKVKEATDFLKKLEAQNIYSADGITMCYNTIMHGLGRGNRNDSTVDEALEIFHRMKKPTLYSFGIIIDIIARSSIPNKIYRAEKVYKQFIFHRNDFKEQSSPEVFNILMNIYAKSHDDYKVRKTLQILKDMKGYGVQPSILTLNTVLNSCSKLSREAPEYLKREALDVAATIFREIQSNRDMIPDAYTYASLLDTCALISNHGEREATARVIFTECTKSGFVNGIVLSRLRSLSRRVFHEFISTDTSGFIQLESLDLDPSWFRNIK